MCLGVPGRIERIWTTEQGALAALADFVGEVRQVCLDYLPDLAVGDYVIVHAGYALTRLTEDSARETIAMMVDLGVIEAPAEGVR
ncbi:HypC/HybG/HupF family hydrogenase formation chaperone [Nocardioides humi]|uniref:HypC/HybG/HupF family hydrogenase formation chaperone n=1 Tax=Nocardioides humi TaxID=449461 RepID=A0ABN2A208_9ACTN|nr:HypC/HybG/HupF family hydrogenase formation chaperone [Nocardioides humi]